MRGQRHGAAAAHGAAHGPFGRHGQPGAGVGQRGQGFDQLGAAGADLDAQSALAGGGQHGVGFEDLADACAQAQALEAGRGQHDAGVLAFVELAQAGVEVAAQGFDAQVGPQRLQQHGAAQAGGAHHGALRQVLQAGMAGRDPGVARVFALHHAGQCEALGQLHGHVLERMHGDVGAALFQRGFQLFHEQALAADLAQRAVQDLVALGGHAQQGDGVAARLQQGLDVFGLPQGQAAFAGGDGDGKTGGGGWAHGVELQSGEGCGAERACSTGARGNWRRC